MFSRWDVPVSQESTFLCLLLEITERRYLPFLVSKQKTNRRKNLKLRNIFFFNTRIWITNRLLNWCEKYIKSFLPKFLTINLAKRIQDFDLNLIPNWGSHPVSLISLIQLITSAAFSSRFFLFLCFQSSSIPISKAGFFLITPYWLYYKYPANTKNSIIHPMNQPQS